MVEDIDQINEKQLSQWLKSCRAQRVMIEYNGMWPLDILFANLPNGWIVYQEMMFADATTFEMYNVNLRERVVDKLQGAQLVVFNRATKGFDKMPLHKIVRGINRNSDIAYEYDENDVEYDDIEDPLPFDKTADVVAIDDRDYALWYRDLSEELFSYNGTTVRFKGQVVVDDTIPGGCFIVGRPLMTCCADDIRFAGLVCEWGSGSDLKSRDWVLIEARISVREHECYGRIGPVLYGMTVAPAEAPEQEVATFY